MNIPKPGNNACAQTGGPGSGSQGVSIRCMKGGSTSGGGDVKDEGGGEDER